jgi:molybdate/tungstate transport system substrate-binding protein
MLRRYLFLPVFLFLFFASPGCKNIKREQVIIFHAGSLSVPLKILAGEFEEENPGSKVLLEPAGSLVCARKVTELKRPCDIVISADYTIIDNLLIPEYAGWNIRFATNEMVLAYGDRSKYANSIDSSNWLDILLKDDVTFSRADPDSDPGGYRTIMTFMLSEKYYGKAGLTKKLRSKDNDFIRPKEVDLVALLEIDAVDYIFIYRSVAVQHGFKYVKLPAAVNLSDPGLNKFYNTVFFYVRGGSPSDSMKVKGEFINYGATVLKNAPNAEKAVAFMDFLLSEKGMQILRKCGQDRIYPYIADHQGIIPDDLLKYLKQ